MRISPKRLLQRFPVTILCVAACIGLYVAVEIDHWQHDDGHRDSIHALGGISHSFIDEPTENLPAGPLGLVDLWNGEIWRIWVTGFHHAGFFHLFFNVLSMLVLGGLLEPRIGSLPLALMVAVSIPVSIVPELWMHNAVVGISGAACALFGVLLVLRQRDFELQHIVSRTVIVVTLASLVGGFVLTALEWVPVANLAHFAGLAWGWLVGEAFYGRFSARRAVRYSTLGAHVLLVPAIYLAVHPFWIGAHQWFRASQAPPDSEKRFERLEAALDRDPNLNNGLYLLARYYIAAGRLDDALRVAFESIRLDDQSPRTRISIPRRVEVLIRNTWRALPTRRERQAVLQTLRDRFGDESRKIERHLLAQSTWKQPQTNAPPEKPAIDLDMLTSNVRSPGQIALDAPQVDPQHPESAALGTLF